MKFINTITVLFSFIYKKWCQMIKLLKGKSGVSNVIFALSVGVLLVICVSLSVMLFYQPSNIQSRYNQLQSDYDQLQIDYGLLQSDYNGLEANYDNLQFEHDILQWQYEQLELNMSNLQSSFDNLNEAYQQLLASVPSEQLTITSMDFSQMGIINCTITNSGISGVTIATIKVNGATANPVTSPVQDLTYDVGETNYLGISVSTVAGNKYQVSLFAPDDTLVGSYTDTA